MKFINRSTFRRQHHHLDEDAEFEKNKSKKRLSLLTSTRESERTSQQSFWPPSHLKSVVNSSETKQGANALFPSILIAESDEVILVESEIQVRDDQDSGKKFDPSGKEAYSAETKLLSGDDDWSKVVDAALKMNEILTVADDKKRNLEIKSQNYQEALTIVHEYAITLGMDTRELFLLVKTSDWSKSEKAKPVETYGEPKENDQHRLQTIDDLSEISEDIMITKRSPSSFASNLSGDYYLSYEDGDSSLYEFVPDDDIILSPFDSMVSLVFGSIGWIFREDRSRNIVGKIEELTCHPTLDPRAY